MKLRDKLSPFEMWLQFLIEWNSNSRKSTRTIITRWDYSQSANILHNLRGMAMRFKYLVNVEIENQTIIIETI